MEKFYIVQANSRLFRDYWTWQNSINSNCTIVRQFCEEHGIESTQFSLGCLQLGIVPTKQDKEKFGKQLAVCRDGQYGIRFFKKNSTIGKAWAAIAKEKIHHSNKPMPGFYNKTNCALSTRLFDYNNKLYCSITGETVDMPDDIFTEIKGSEFYRVLEKTEEEEALLLGE